MKIRNIYKPIKKYLAKYPIIALTGPRQSGKTTFLKSMFKKYTYINLEDPDLRAYATTDPRSFLQEYDSKIIFDEVQRVPELFSYLQTIVDEKKIMGQFILSGSQNFNLMESITQTLAGRVAVFSLFPFDLIEMKKAKWLSKDLGQLMSKGFYPAVHAREINPDRYYADYLKTYVNRDVSQLINIQNDRLFSAFIRLCAARVGQLVNFNVLARDTGISHNTARNWLSILQTSYIIKVLKPHYNNYSKRIIKSPKIYFYDTGLLCHLLNIRKAKLKPSHPMWGNIFENFIVIEMEKQNAHLDLLREYYFWRDSHGNEVDLLYQENQSMHAYEIKSSSTMQNRMLKGLDYFGKLTEVNTTKNLIYGGARNYNRTDYLIQAWSALAN